MQGIQNIREEQFKVFHDKVYEEADGITRYFIIGYFFFGVFLSVFYSTWELGLVMGGVSIGLYYLVQTLSKGTFLSRLTVSFLFWNFPFQFILQLHGTYEMYFFYFVSLTVLLFYEDWRLLMPAIIYSIFTFLFLFYCKLYGTELKEYMNNIPDLNYKNALLHVAIITLYAGLCVLWSKLQRDQTKQAAITNLDMQGQLKLMDININFADNISQGDLKAKYGAEEPDKLGKALMDMRESLVEASDRESKERFVNVGLASIGDILRSNSDDLNKLCDMVIQELVKYMKVNQGGIFIITENDNGSDRHLELMACRAYERKKYLKKRVEIGEGLVGQSAIERKFIHLKEIPSNYVNISSGLGTSRPNSLLIVPLQSNDEMVGVIEMASFKDFEQNDIEFLEKVGESIASSIISAKTNQATVELLQQSREMTEQMQAQEEEMRQNMEEMQATQEEMARAQKELSAKEANFNALINNTTDSIITIDREYKIVIMNEVQKARYRGTQYEAMKEGSNALDMLGSVREEWKGYYDRAFAGEALNFTIKSSVQGENSWREYYINPIRDNHGGTVGASIFSRDITSRKRIEESAKTMSNVVGELLNTSSDMLMAIDSKYNLLVSNDKFKDESVEILGARAADGVNLLENLEGARQSAIKEQYDKALAGEEFDDELKVANGVLVNHYKPIINEDDEVIGVAIKTHFK